MTMDTTAPRSPVASRPGGLVLYGILVTAAAAACGGAAPAQDPALLVSSTPAVPREGKDRKVVRLRPNVAGQTSYLFVRNPGQDDVTVSVALRGADGGPDVLRTKPFAVKAGRTDPVVFEPAAPAPPAAPAVPAGQPAPPAGRELPGPPFSYEFVLLDAQGKPVPDSARPVELMQPADYVEPPKVSFNGNTRELQVTVTAKDTFSPEPKAAPVALVLSPAHVPGLVDTPDKAGAYLRYLTRAGQSVKLVAKNLHIDEKDKRREETENGLVYLTVDGYERAFAFRVTFGLEGEDHFGDLIPSPVVGLHWPRYQQPAPACHVDLTVDNAPPDSVVEVGLKHDEEATAFADDDIKLLRAPRDQHIRVATGADGGVAFETTVRDWATDMDSTGLFNDHALRVRLLRKGEPLPTLDARDLQDPRAEPTKEVEVPVTFDGSPPEIKTFGVQLTRQEKGKPVEFLATSETPRADNQIPTGQPLRVVAVAADPESKVTQVVFFLGKPTPDLKIPEMVVAVPGEPKGDRGTTWQAQLPAPPAAGGVVPVGVQVTNGAGLKSFGTIEIKLVPPPPPPPAGPPPKPSIEGTVVDGAGRGQPTLPVTLTDAQGVARDSVKTDAAGKFLFKDVLPGSYRVSAAKTANGTRGETAVQVAEGEKKTGVEVRLKAP
jgi:hypothetical protein